MHICTLGPNTSTWHVGFILRSVGDADGAWMHTGNGTSFTLEYAKLIECNNPSKNRIQLSMFSGMCVSTCLSVGDRRDTSCQLFEHCYLKLWLIGKKVLEFQIISCSNAIFTWRCGSQYFHPLKKSYPTSSCSHFSSTHFLALVPAEMEGKLLTGHHSLIHWQPIILIYTPWYAQSIEWSI